MVKILWATLPFAMLISALCGLVIGFPSLRLKGDYLAIATLGFGEIVRNVINNWDALTNGPMGIQKIPMAEIFGFIHQVILMPQKAILLFSGIHHAFRMKAILTSGAE